MKIHPFILTTTVALFTGVAFAAEPTDPATTKKSSTTLTLKNAGGTATASGSASGSGTHSTSTSVNVTNNNGKGKATITIDVNGKKETREIDLGDATEISVNSVPLEAGGGLGANLDVFGTAGGLGGGAVAVGSLGEPKNVTWLGVAPEEISEELRSQLPLEPGSGLLVRSVVADSPAAKAGLQKNDVLMKLDDQLLTNPGQLRTLVAAKKDGDVTKLTFFRQGKLQTLDVKLGTHEERIGGTFLKDIPNLGDLFQVHRKAVVVDKDGQVLGGDGTELDSATEKLTKTLREMGVEESTIQQAKKALSQTSDAIREALADANVAKNEVKKGSGDIAEALKQVTEAIEKVRKQAEEAVRVEREKRKADDGHGN